MKSRTHVLALGTASLMVIALFGIWICPSQACAATTDFPEPSATLRSGFALEPKDEKTSEEKEKLNKALSEAVVKNDTATVLAMIKKGADVHWCDPQSNRKTPLVKAIMYSRRLEMVKLLVENGADVHFPDGSGKYPILYCAFTTVEIAEFIIAKGGSKEINYYGSATEKQPYGIGKTALTCVCAYSNVSSDMIPILLKGGANPNQRWENGKGPTVLILAIRNDNPKNFDKVKAVQTLIEHGADVNLKGTLKNGEETTALREAKKNGYKEIVEILEKAGAKE